jgi:hypothetical protein
MVYCYWDYDFVCLHSKRIITFAKNTGGQQHVGTWREQMLRNCTIAGWWFDSTLAFFRNKMPHEACETGFLKWLEDLGKKIWEQQKTHVAQRKEQRATNPYCGGSNPLMGSKSKEDKMEENEIKKLICEIIDDSSGGIKFLDLAVKLQLRTNYQFDADELERIVRNTEGVKVLDYTWHYLNRSKMFVYTP